MRPKLLLALAPLLAYASTLAAPTDPDREDLDPTEVARITREVETFLERYRSRMAGDDAELMRDLVVADERFALWEDGELRFADVDAIVESGPGVEIEFGQPDLLILDRRRVHLTTQFRSSPPGGRADLVGVGTWLLERDDELWRLVRGHASSVRR